MCVSHVCVCLPVHLCERGEGVWHMRCQPSCILWNLGVARLVLDSQEAFLDIATMKLKRLCLDDFAQAARGGTCGTVLYRICNHIRHHLRADVADNEGYNPLVRCLTTRSRHSGLPLVSARANLKKFMHVCGRGVTSKWSRHKDSRTIAY